MKKKIKNLLKSNHTLYKLYNVLFSTLLRAASFFIKVDPTQVLFVVYGGKRYDDSPKVVYEYMKKDTKYSKYKYVWAFESNIVDSINIPYNEKIKIDSLKYFKMALKSGYWLTNSSASRGLNFRNSKTKNIMFQHGTAGIKKIGNDINQGNDSFRGFSEKFDIIFTQGSNIETEILVRAWGIDNSDLSRIGLPRNDELFSDRNNAKKIQILKNKLGIPLNKKVILYAPTFREYSKDSEYAPYLTIPFDIEKWREELDKEYVLLITAHYEVSKVLNLPETDSFIINAFEYPFINDLMLVSDILISDYSSIILDYLILEKPIFSYAYDYKVYLESRGLYPNYQNLFMDGPIEQENELIQKIKNLDIKEYSNFSKLNKEKFINSTEPVVEKVVEKIFCEE